MTGEFEFLSAAQLRHGVAAPSILFFRAVTGRDYPGATAVTENTKELSISESVLVIDCLGKFFD